MNSSTWACRLCFIAMILFAGCTDHSRSTASLTKAPATVNLAIWSNYLTPEILQKFEAKTGIKVQTSNYSSNEELLAKLQTGSSEYDVVVPSDYMVFVMI